MSKYLIILALLLGGLTASAQDSLQTLGGTVNALFNALQDSSATQRSQELGQLLLPGASMNSIVMTDRISSRIALGKLSDFLSNSAEFYAAFHLSLDEFDRSVDYYADLASVNSLVFQTVERKSDGQRFEQEIWYAIDLVYQQGRWYVAHITWTSSYGSASPSVPADTLWHRVEKR